MSKRTETRLVVGCMTGTSLDGLDAALVEVRGVGLEITARCVRRLSRPLGEIGEELRSFAQQRPMSAGRIAALSREFSLLHVAAIRELLSGQRADLISVHGQTVFHAPPVSWQLLTPAVIAAGVGAPVVSDLRAADLAAGGQGAPITPLADYVLFRSPSETRVVLNLGGFCNFTRLPAASGPESISGGDICVCNQLLDGLSRRLLETPFDDGGRTALAGAMRPELVAAIHQQLRAQSRGGRSLGTGDEIVRRVDEIAGAISAADLLRGVCEAIAATIAGAIGATSRVIVAGGGARNAALVAAIERHCGVAVTMSGEFGVSIEAREAVAMAVLGALCQDGVAITLAQVTGRASAVARSGSWVHG